MKTIAIIQARMGSTRLPGKVLMDIAGEPMLARVLKRVRRASMLDEIVIATTREPADQAIADFCAAHGCRCFRGSSNDVLDRYYQAARQCGAGVVVRLTADCPLLDPVLIDRVVTTFHQRWPAMDYVSNVLPPRTFPRGLDTEVFSFDALAQAWRDDQDPAGREHVTPFLYRHPERFRLYRIAADADYSHLRCTVDTSEDRELAVRIYHGQGHDDFSWRDMIAFLTRQPHLLEINRAIQQKAV
ncbi:MAG TPA: glycosyltransferase family protein [Gemmataceae bacterium]|jgi:spore coat polysaccharide biosynthesis protein SpsF